MKFQSSSDNDLEVCATIIGIISTAIPDSDYIKRIINVSESQAIAETYIASYVVPRLYLKGQTMYIQHDLSLIHI